MAKVEEIITDRIIKKLEEGTVPWHKPWNGGEDAPKNLVSKKEYHGINAFLTACSSYASPYWLSYKQCTELGGKVKTGEKGTPVIYWNWVVKNEETDEEKKVPFMRYYTVFNLEQCEGIPEDKIPAKPEPREIPLEPIQACEDIVAKMPHKPEIKHGKAAAFYSPALDYVNMPRMDTFDGQCEYYSTLFHELTHSTGHQDRLGRKCINDCSGWSSFGTTPYAKEELVAEMGAAFLCGHVGIENTTIDNSAAYIASWLKRLRNDSKLVIVAAGQAQKASDYILGKREEKETSPIPDRLAVLHNQACKSGSARAFREKFGEKRGDPNGAWKELGFKSATDFFDQAIRLVPDVKIEEDYTKYGFTPEEVEA